MASQAVDIPQDIDIAGKAGTLGLDAKAAGIDPAHCGCAAGLLRSAVPSAFLCP